MGVYFTSYAIGKELLEAILLKQVDFETWDVYQHHHGYLTTKVMDLGPVSHLWEYLKINYDELPLFGHKLIFDNESLVDPEPLTVKLTTAPVVSQIRHQISSINWDGLVQSYQESIVDRQSVDFYAMEDSWELMTRVNPRWAE